MILRSILSWTESDLINSPFHVKVTKEISRQFKAISGVVKGSNLEPLLFILFTSDIWKGIHLKILMFAYDLKIYTKLWNYKDFVDLKKSKLKENLKSGSGCKLHAPEPRQDSVPGSQC